MKYINPLAVPDPKTFADFCKYWLTSGPYYSTNSPLKHIMIGPTSTETIVFSHPPYQVELYILDNIWIPPHYHPHCDTVEVRLNEHNHNKFHNFDPSCVLTRNSTHGGKTSILNQSSHMLFVLQHWHDINKMDHITLTSYVGPPLSSIHTETVRARYPGNVTVKDNKPWIDCT